MKLISKLIFFWLCILVTGNAAGQELGWYTVTGTEVNVRSGPGTNYSKLGTRKQGDVVTVLRIYDENWAIIEWHFPTYGYMHRDYITYKGPVHLDPPKKKEWTFLSVISLIWLICKIILVIVAIYYWQERPETVLMLAVFFLVGALLGFFIFHQGNLGAFIGLVVGIVADYEYDRGYFTEDPFIIKCLRVAYASISLPFNGLNRLQHALSSPWRFTIRNNRFSDRKRARLRTVYRVLRVLLYILLTPLRLLNSIYFNLVVHVINIVYDFLLEVALPSSKKEGANNLGLWLLLLPWRLFKYPVLHGIIAVIDGLFFTIVEIFVPTVTLYHGTDLTAAQGIVGCRNRNEYLKWELSELSGSFRASSDSWGGIGVYFASKRRIADNYARYRKLSDNNPITIVCRVSMGRILEFSLAPSFVCDEIGKNGQHSVINRYAEQHHYETGEWWNGSYWEYCMFDWQNLYNHRWRIRPLYLFNHRTMFIQHVKGGKSHWLFNF